MSVGIVFKFYPQSNGTEELWVPIQNAEEMKQGPGESTN